jgi:hypothetical protein
MNYYISTIDSIPVMYDGEQLVFAPNGVELMDIVYTDLLSLREDQHKTAVWRKEQGFDNIGRYGYWRVKLDTVNGLVPPDQDTSKDTANKPTPAPTTGEDS